MGDFADDGLELKYFGSWKETEYGVKVGHLLPHLLLP